MLGHNVHQARRDILGWSKNKWTRKNVKMLEFARVEVLLKPSHRESFVECLREDPHSQLAMMKQRFFLVPTRLNHFIIKAFRSRDINPTAFAWPQNLGQVTQPFRIAVGDPGAPTQSIASPEACVIALDGILEGPVRKLLQKKAALQSAIKKMQNALGVEDGSIYPSREKCSFCLNYALCRGKGGGLCRAHASVTGPAAKKSGQLRQRGKEFRKLNKLKRRALDTQRRIENQLDAHYKQFGASVAADPSFDVLFLPRLALAQLKRTKSNSKLVRQLLQHLSLAKLDEAIRRACKRAGKVVHKTKEWGTTLKEAFPVTVETDDGTFILFHANPIGPSKYQLSQTGLCVPRDFESCSHSLLASMSTSKERRNAVFSFSPAKQKN
jgi:hypothetical protein